MNADSAKGVATKNGAGKDGTGKGQRILALWLPYLATERILRQRLGRSWRSRPRPYRPPLVLSRREGNARRIAALDERAEALGLRRGMGLADALAMHPALDVAETDPPAERRLLEGLADWCDRYTPLVALDGADGLFLDITGCAHLFGGERAMVDDMLARFLHQGFEARAGIASSPGAAWAAARFASGSIVAPGEEAGFLAPLPLAALRLDQPACAGLESVGLWTVGALMALPRAPLARRFGLAPLLNLDRALGRLEEPVSPRRPVAALSVERHLAEPVVLVEDIELLTGLLATTLRPDLERRGEGARALDLILFRVDGAVTRLSVRTSRPVREPGLIRRLFHERLAAVREDFDAGYGFDLVRLCVPASAAYRIDQAGFIGKARDETADIALFADRVAARLGSGTILGPVVAASHIPERSVMLAPFGEAVSGKAEAGSDAPPASPVRSTQRPIRLFRSPEPIEVPATELPEGPPWQFRWRRALHRIARAEGPERIAAEWWLEEAPARDYFRVEDADGRRYWLYREGLYGGEGPAPRWFMHGVFA